MHVTEEGEIFVLTREARLIPRINKDRPVMDDLIIHLSSDGKEIGRVSMIDMFENSDYAAMVEQSYRTGGDVFHTNTLEMIGSARTMRHDAFRPGNFLISMRTPSVLAVVDLASAKVVWARQGDWQFQHEPQLLPSGNIVFFDNRSPDQHYSRVLELDPGNDEIVWEYKGTPPESFYSRFCGTVQVLLNGNLLVTESTAGRAFELAKDEQEIVWEYVSPHRAGPNDELIAALLHMTRLDPDFPTDWLLPRP
jgi:hypothetical protein